MVTNKIQAIKAIRELGMTLGLEIGLKQSKDFIDSLWGQKIVSQKNLVTTAIRDYQSLGGTSQTVVDVVNSIYTFGSQYTSSVSMSNQFTETMVRNVILELMHRGYNREEVRNSITENMESLLSRDNI